MKVVLAVVCMFGFLGVAQANKTQPRVIANFAEKPDRKVQVGGSEDFDACGGNGIATVTTTVFTKDKNNYDKFEKVDVNTNVILCDAEGDYYGIVYTTNSKQDCGVSGPIKDKKDYKGPCKSGWIKKDFFYLTAG